MVNKVVLHTISIDGNDIVAFVDKRSLEMGFTLFFTEEGGLYRLRDSEISMCKDAITKGLALIDATNKTLFLGRKS